LICSYFRLNPRQFIQQQQPRPGDVIRHLGDNSQFKHVIGFSPRIDIEEGIRLTIEWFQSLPLKAEDLMSGEILRNWE